MDGRVWWSTVHGITESDMTERLHYYYYYNVGDPGSIPGSRRSPGEGNGTPLQYSGLENPMDRGAWQAAVRGVTKSQTRLSD